MKEATAAILVGATLSLAATALAQTIIYFESGEVVETNKDVYLSNKQLYTAKGGRNSKLVIKPASPATGAEETEECDPDGLTFGGVCVEEEEQELTFGGN